MIIYIAGKMSGLPDKGRAAFSRAEQELRKAGHIALNPAVMPIGMPREKYMPICLAMLAAADAIYMLPGWEDSPGARLEHDYAVYHGKKVCGHGRWKPLLRSDGGKVLVWGHKESGCMVADKMLTCPECGADMRGGYEGVTGMTNAEKYFRNATDEELAELFANCCWAYTIGDEYRCVRYNEDCEQCWLDWLTSRQGGDAVCKWMSDDGKEICCNGDCPCCADFCPTSNWPGVCRWEEVDDITAKAWVDNAPTIVPPDKEASL